MPDRYRNFGELARHEIAGRDFAIEYIDRGSRVLVMAPHGGEIEPNTSDIARAVAGNDLSFYTFAGLKPRDNRLLHITSSAFDERTALSAAGKAEVVLTVHGHMDPNNAFVMVGGLHSELVARLGTTLQAFGFRVRPPEAGKRGSQPSNICNRGTTGRGVQLEISRRSREDLCGDSGLMARFIAAIRGPLLDVQDRGIANPQ